MGDRLGIQVAVDILPSWVVRLTWSLDLHFLAKCYFICEFFDWEKKYQEDAVQKMWNASRFCVSSLRRGHANLLCIVPILVYVLPKQVQQFEEIWLLWWSQFWNQHGHDRIPWYRHIMSWNHDNIMSWLFQFDSTQPWILPFAWDVGLSENPLV